MTSISKTQNKREIAKVASRPKSSPDARRFIEQAVKKCGNERDAAIYLGLPNHGQLHKMRIGALHDTPAMLAYIRLRKARAKRAYNKSFYSMSDPKPDRWIDYCATLKVVQDRLDEVQAMIRAIRETEK